MNNKALPWPARTCQPSRPIAIDLLRSIPNGMAQKILDAVAESADRWFVPVLVLTRFASNATTEHPFVQEFLVKPQSLRTISETIRRLAAHAAK